MVIINQLCQRGALALIAWCLLIPINGTAKAQKPPTLPAIFDKQIHLDMTDASMDDALAALLKAAPVSILADGVPYLQKANLKFDGNLSGGLDLLARTFDYAWTLSKSGAVLMSKRFAEAADRPQMNLPEMLEMTRNIIQALHLVDYDLDEANASGQVEKMVKSLPQQQQQVLISGGMLNGSSLTPDQQALLNKATLTKTFSEPLQAWQNLLPKLEGMPTSHLEARKREDLPQVNAPTHDYFYVTKEKDGSPHVYDLPHIVFQINNDRIVTP